MKSIARWLFQTLARLVLRRYRPVVIGVAGSIGKTATKEAIAAALDSPDRPVRQTRGSFNAEIGVPVTILSGGPAQKRWWQWLRVFVGGVSLLLRRQPYPAVLILELGTDKPGDLGPLLRLAKPRIGVLTAIAPEHLEFFGDLAGVAAEEAGIITTLPAEGTAVVNIDDEQARAVAKPGRVRTISYGWTPEAQIRAEHLDLTTDDRGQLSGMVVKVRLAGEVVPIGIPGVIGRHQAYPILAAVAVAEALGESAALTIERLKRYQPPPGRMRLLAGLSGSLIIDDSYNASPAAMAAALVTLFELKTHGRKLAVLGQMSELGSSAAYWHDWVGEKIGHDRLHELITIGPLADRIGRSAVAHGFSASRTVNVPTAEAAAARLQSDLHPGDVVLLKGSRYAAHLERAAAILLAHPDRDQGRLVSS
ncbi:MAG: UDP-N-acetylmuramoyl-tripeptide--D-alanyl-D-alanine ligase [Candidatus Kerfeldbacteria bacterium]|nr:UDP-N-acetylmuramoyl-tripeptide--D-alanyl-D-alanine ligase [Candidatus Kerfeldbacteria bacterium]